MKYFTVEVRVNALRAQGMANNKKLAKQAAAKNLLLNLGVDVDMDKSSTFVNKVNVFDEILERKIEELGINISEDKLLGPIVELSNKAQSVYLERTNKVTKADNLPEHLIKNIHVLFEDAYLTKIPDNIKEKMQIISINQPNLIREIRQYIERTLKLKIEQFIIQKSKAGYVICLRLLSVHNITQIGIGETESKAETVAMCNVITAISILLN